MYNDVVYFILAWFKKGMSQSLPVFFFLFYFLLSTKNDEIV